MTEVQAQPRKTKLIKPVAILWFLAFLGIASTGFALWGVWRIVDLSERFQSKDDQTLVLAVGLKEHVAAYSKLTYDFLLQQDFNRMLLKERQAGRTRESITEDLGALALHSPTGSAGSVIETIRFNVMQFLVLTDKALETAVEEGSNQRARSLLQEEVEPALKTAQDSLTTLINSRQKFSSEHVQFLRQQSVMIMFLLIGVGALGLALILSARMHLLQTLLQMGKNTETKVETPLPALNAASAVSEEEQAKERRKVLEARSLNTLALINRLNRLHKESEDARKIMASVLRHTDENTAMLRRAPSTEKDFQVLQQQKDKIAQAISRIEHVQAQGKQFIENMNELMGGVQGLATEGNVVALNVTIELAKIYSHGAAPQTGEKNTKISDQIRALATTAAGITGRMAMILSQFRYAHDDFTRHMADLTAVRGESQEALEHIRKALHDQDETNADLASEKKEMVASLPLLNEKLDALEKQVLEIQALAEEEVDEIIETHPARSFKVIEGGAA